MRNFRYYFRLTIAFVSKFKGLIAIGIFTGILIFLALRFFGPLLRGSNERIGIVGKYSTSNLPNSILYLISGGLTETDDSGLTKPLLSSSWEATDNGKTWIFHLKKGVKWQDGKEITSADLNYNLSDVKSEKPDSKTIIFKLQSPFSPFPGTVSKPIFKKGFLGFGQWKVSKMTIAGGYVQKIILANKEKVKNTYKFYPTEEQAKLGFKLGEVNRLVDIFNPTPIDTWKTVKVTAYPNRGEVVAIFFNTSAESRLLSEKSVRQALSYAIDKDKLDSARAISPISPLSWAYNPQVKPYNYDPKKAKELIDTLAKELKENSGVRLVTTPVLINQAERIAKDWEAVGIKVILQVTSIIPSDYDAYLAILDIPKDPDQYAIWHSSQVSTNISKYTNPRIDKLLEDGRTELDPEARKKIYLDFQRFLVEDSPAVFLYHPTSYTIERK